MKTQHAVLIVLIAIAHCASAQDHLVPDADGLIVTPRSYGQKAREVFAKAFEAGVTSRAIVFPSFEIEYAVGLRKTKKGVEAFVLRASSSIWEVEFREMHEDGRMRVVDEDGKPVPLDQDEEYQELKKRTPSDHRKIKVDQRARPIPADFAAQIDAIWHVMLRNARQHRHTGFDCDGITYHFSALVPPGRRLSGHVYCPEEDSKTGRLVALTETLADFASGKADLKKLNDQVQRATKP
jgi:hypothetical protein